MSCMLLAPGDTLAARKFGILLHPTYCLGRPDTLPGEREMTPGTSQEGGLDQRLLVCSGECLPFHRGTVVASFPSTGGTAASWCQGTGPVLSRCQFKDQSYWQVSPCHCWSSERCHVLLAVRCCGRVDFISSDFNSLMLFFKFFFWIFNQGKRASEVRNCWVFLCSFRYKCQWREWCPQACVHNMDKGWRCLVNVS